MATNKLAEQYPMKAQMVYLNKTLGKRYTEPSFYETKNLLTYRTRGRAPRLRLGLYVSACVPSMRIHTGMSKEDILDSHCTGTMSVEVDEARAQIVHKVSNDYMTANATLDVVLVEKVFQLFLESIKHADQNPLLRIAPEGGEQREFASDLQGKGAAGQYPKPSATEEEQRKKAEKRRRQKQAKTSDQLEETFVKRQQRTYNAHLRIAYAAYVKVPSDYYYPWKGMWDPPPPGEHFDEDHRYVLRLQPKGQPAQDTIKERSANLKKVTQDLQESLRNH